MLSLTQPIDITFDELHLDINLVTHEIKLDGQQIGHVGYHNTINEALNPLIGEVIEILDLYVEPLYRSKGIGKIIISRFIQLKKPFIVYPTNSNRTTLKKLVKFYTKCNLTEQIDNNGNMFFTNMINYNEIK